MRPSFQNGSLRVARPVEWAADRRYDIECPHPVTPTVVDVHRPREITTAMMHGAAGG